jgi:hypothetical protein
MIAKSKLLYLLGIVFLSLLFGCTEKFDKTKWVDDDAIGGPEKVLMAEDLIKTNKLIGLTNKQMLKLLGPPANYTDTTKTYYELSQEFDSIDPVSGKNLIITFNKDSIINAEIIKWHKH